MSRNYKEIFKKLPPHLIIIGVLGLIFVLMGNPLDKDDPNFKEQIPETEIKDNELEKNVRNTDEANYKAQMERDFERILSNVSGAGDVQVMLSLKGSSKLDLVKNIDQDQTITTEVDGSEGKREIKEVFSQEQVLTTRENGKEQPMVIREFKPEIRGIVIVAEGGENLNVVKQLVGTANSLFGIPKHNIQVLPKSSE